MRKLVTLDGHTSELVMGLEKEGFSFSKLCCKLIKEFTLERDNIEGNRKDGRKKS